MLNNNYLDEFIGFRNELHSYLFRLLTNRADCEDVIQETYIKVVDHIHTFRGECSFKSWVYGIATNLAKNILSRQKRWQADYQDKGRDLHMSDESLSRRLVEYISEPESNFELTQHLDYCFTCISKTLPLVEQICLLLKDVYGFQQDEIQTISGLTEGKVKHGIVNARKTMMKIFDQRCSLVNKQGACDQCAALKGFLSPEQNAQQEANQLKLAQEAQCRSSEQLLELRLDIVRSTDPINNTRHGLHIYFLENLPDWADRMDAKTESSQPTE